MSESSRTTLDDFLADGPQQETWQRLDEGARYGRGGSDSATPDREPADAGRCRNCGAEIDSAVQRIVGDRHGRVPRCKRCSANHYGQEFLTTTSAVTAYRNGVYSSMGVDRDE